LIVFFIVAFSWYRFLLCIFALCPRSFLLIAEFSWPARASFFLFLSSWSNFRPNRFLCNSM
jgi:hypothetical protein